MGESARISGCERDVPDLIAAKGTRRYVDFEYSLLGLARFYGDTGMKGEAGNQIRASPITLPGKPQAAILP